MNDQLARTLFMDYLYDEISAEEKNKLESYLDDHPSLRKELEGLQHTRSLLQKMPLEEPAQRLLVMEAKERGWKQWWQDAKALMPRSTWGKTGFAIAAGFVLMLIIGSASGLTLSSTDAGFSLSLGQQPQTAQGLTENQAEMLLTQIREENADMLAQFASSINEQNRVQLQQVVQYFEQQRLNDLQLIDHNLDQFQQASNYRWRQANEYWGDLIQTVSLNNEQ